MKASAVSIPLSQVPRQQGAFPSPEVATTYFFEFHTCFSVRSVDRQYQKEDNLGVLNSTAWQLCLSVDVFGKRFGGDRLGDYIDEYY